MSHEKVYSNCRIYGPYVAKDGRKRIYVVFSNGRKTTISYPKYLMELHLNRYLTRDETVDHIDCDYTNDNLSNLQILSKSEHGKADATRVGKLECVCICGRKFLAVPRDVFHNRKKGKSGPYCSRTCAGRYSHRGPRSRK